MDVLQAIVLGVGDPARLGTVVLLACLLNRCWPRKGGVLITFLWTLSMRFHGASKKQRLTYVQQAAAAALERDATRKPARPLAKPSPDK